VSIRREATLNFITYFGPRLTSLGVFAWLVPVALHSLGQARYAVLMTVLLVVGLVPLLDTGISYALTFRYTRALRRDRRGGALLLKEHRRVYLLVSMAAAAFFLAAFPWIFKSARGQLGDDFTVAMEAGAAAVFFMLLSGYNRAVLVANGKSYLVNLSDFSGDLLRGIAVGIGAAWYRDLGVTLALIAAAFAVRWIMMAVITARKVPGHATATAGRIRRRSLRASLWVGIPFAFSALITVIFGLLDKAVIARTQPLSELAAYSLSYDITTKGWMFVWAINGAILPILMRWGHAREEDKIAKAFEYSWWAVAAVVVAIYLPLNLFERPLMGWWVGLEMARDARYYIAIFSLSSLCYFVVCVFYNFFQASGRTKEIAKAYAIGLIFYLLGVTAGALSGNMLIMAAAHVALWIAVALSMSYMFARDLRGRRAAS
jgi:O-antigen/teichoic acid export membrane protein